MRRAWALVVLCVGCSASSRTEDACLVDSAEEPLTRTCFRNDLEPESNPDSPDYGRVRCALIVSGVAGTPFCDCTRPGFAPATAAQSELAREENRVRGLCLGACCENMCSCQLLQLSGDELAECQGRGESESPPRGWCYVEPDAGFGDPSTVEECPSTQRRLIRVLPSSIMNGLIGTLACID